MVQEALRRTDREDVPLSWLTRAGSNRVIDSCLAALPVRKRCTTVHDKISDNASRLLHLLRFFSKQDLRPCFTEQACLEVNGDMPIMVYDARDKRKALLCMLNDQMDHDLFAKFFWYWSDNIVLKAWKAVGAHKKYLVKILRDGRVEVAKKMLMHSEEITEQEAEKHITIFFGYSFVSERAIENAIYRGAWQDVSQLHSLRQRPRKSALVRSRHQSSKKSSKDVHKTPKNA